MKINGGDRVWTRLGTYNPTYFIVYSQNKPVNFNGTFVQERAANMMLLQEQPPLGKTAKLVSFPTDLPWKPAFGGDPTFLTSDSLVTDKKGYPNQGKYLTVYNLWSKAIPKDGVFMTSRQTFRFVMTDPCGKQITFPCSTAFTVKFVTDDEHPGQYMVVHE